VWKIMTDNAHLLGIDVGTSGCKVLLIDALGKVLADETREYPLQMPRPLWSEQNPEDWWNAVSAGIAGVLSKSGVKATQIAGVGLTGQMHGLVLLDSAGRVLRPCILWNDQRTAAQCAAITARVGARRVLQLTGNPILTGFTAPKLLWVRENEPHVYDRVAHVLLPKDYIRYRLAGEFLGDVSDSSGTSLFDVARRQWSDEMLAALNAPRAWLPEVTESPVASARVSPAAARETGLAAGTPIVAGAGDQAAQAVGTGIIAEGPISVTLGTSGVVFAASNSYRVEPEGRLHAFCHAVPGMWHLMGVMLSAGGSFEWFSEQFGPHELLKRFSPAEKTTPSAGFAALKDDRDALTAAAASVPPGSEGLFFLPYLTGERTPHADPNARGAFIGLTPRHDVGHLTRALLEGVSFGLRDALELMRALKLPIKQVRASGGGAKSASWRQILADVFNAEIVTLNVTQGAAFGAALLAGVGAGVFADVADACGQVLRPMTPTTPGAAVRTYEQYYPVYRALYPALAASFATITELVSRSCRATKN
jgi:xylulokinase